MIQNNSVPKLNLAPKLKRPLSLWNPLDYLRLLYWIFFFPQAFNWYVNTYGGKTSTIQKRKSWKLSPQNLIQFQLFIQGLFWTVAIAIACFFLFQLLSRFGISLSLPDKLNLTDGLIAGLCVGLYLGIDSGLYINLTTGLAIGLASGLAFFFAIAIGVQSGLAFQLTVFAVGGLLLGFICNLFRNIFKDVRQHTYSYAIVGFAIFSYLGWRFNILGILVFIVVFCLAYLRLDNWLVSSIPTLLCFRYPIYLLKYKIGCDTTGKQVYTTSIKSYNILFNSSL
jgi:hypothetical protein